MSRDNEVKLDIMEDEIVDDDVMIDDEFHFEDSDDAGLGAEGEDLVTYEDEYSEPEEEEIDYDQDDDIDTVEINGDSDSADESVNKDVKKGYLSSLSEEELAKKKQLLIKIASGVIGAGVIAFGLSSAGIIGGGSVQSQPTSQLQPSFGQQEQTSFQGQPQGQPAFQEEPVGHFQESQYQEPSFGQNQEVNYNAQQQTGVVQAQQQNVAQAQPDFANQDKLKEELSLLESEAARYKVEVETLKRKLRDAEKNVSRLERDKSSPVDDEKLDELKKEVSELRATKYDNMQKTMSTEASNARLTEEVEAYKDMLVTAYNSLHKYQQVTQKSARVVAKKAPIKESKATPKPEPKEEFSKNWKLKGMSVNVAVFEDKNGTLINKFIGEEVEGAVIQSINPSAGYVQTSKGRVNL